MKMYFFNSFLFILILLLVGCDSKIPDSPTTSGKLKVAADESFKFLVDAEVDSFMSTYPKSSVEIIYVPEDKAIQLLLQDSVQLAVVTRELNQSEKKELERSKQSINQPVKIAIDAVALIVNKESSDTIITQQQLKDIFSGKIKTWKELNPKSNNENEITIIFDNANSSNFNYMSSQFEMQNVDKLNLFGAKTNPAVIEQVQKNKNALGVIGVGWISDRDDPQQLSFLESIQVMQVTSGSDTSVAQYFKPFQAYLATKEYPLRRELFSISKTQLGRGFSAFMADDKGQRIIKLLGLLPANAPVRIIETRDSL